MNDGEKPATRQDLDDLKKELLAADARLEEKLLAADARLKEELKEELVEAMREIETHLLQAFYGYTEAVQKHLVDLDRSDGSIRDRLGNLENRVKELERRVNFPDFNP